MQKMYAALIFVAACGGGTDTSTFSVSVTASSPTPAEGDRITVKATVKGGVGDLTYKWEQTSPATPKVAFSGALLPETQVTVPGLCADTTFELKVTVSDSDNKKTSATTSFAVTNSNDPLELRNVTVSKTQNVVVGDLLTLTAEAVGPGCGPKFNWTQQTAPTTGGYEGMQNAVSATWRAPETPGSYTVQLVVSDEGGTSLPARDTTITVGAPVFTRDIQPILNDTCGGCHGGTNPQPNSGGLMSFRLDQNMASAIQTELARMPSDGTCGAPAGSPFLTGGNLDASVLWKRIELSPMPGRPSGCDQMPRNNTGFFTQNKDLYVRMKVWIASGAAF